MCQTNQQPVVSVQKMAWLTASPDFLINSWNKKIKCDSATVAHFSFAADSFKYIILCRGEILQHSEMWLKLEAKANNSPERLLQKMYAIKSLVTTHQASSKNIFVFLFWISHFLQSRLLVWVYQVYQLFQGHMLRATWWMLRIDEKVHFVRSQKNNCHLRALVSLSFNFNHRNINRTAELHALLSPTFKVPYKE